MQIISKQIYTGKMSDLYSEKILYFILLLLLYLLYFLTFLDDIIETDY